MSGIAQDSAGLFGPHVGLQVKFGMAEISRAARIEKLKDQMSQTLKVGLFGLGVMGRTHYNCYLNNESAQVVAVCDADPRKRGGDWSVPGKPDLPLVDLSGLRIYGDAAEIIADPEVDAIDICLPTPAHARWTIAALNAGKHVLCEKPMAMNADECEAVRAAQAASGRILMVAHCLRFWTQYIKAHEIISSGEFGKVTLARFHRSGRTPTLSWDDWLRDAPRSGGAVFDMHIHDADAALWWFGKPDQIIANGVLDRGLPMAVEAQWLYTGGPLVNIFGAWDNNGGQFRSAFTVVMEKATIEWDNQKGPEVLMHQAEGTSALEVDGSRAYQNEIDHFVDCVLTGKPSSRLTLEGSQLVIEMVREELRQMEAAA